MTKQGKKTGDLSAFEIKAPSGVDKGKALAVTGGPLIVAGDIPPDYLCATGAGRGSEHVAIEDLVIPRLEVVQALSPAVKDGDPGFIQGARPGMLTNSVTRQLYGTEVFVVPVHYTKQFLVWKERKAGGGFFGAFATPEDAKGRIATIEGDKSQIMVIDTPQHLCLIVTDGKAEKIMIPMPRTKAKISRQWNTFVSLAGGDRFARVYRVGVQMQKNQKGDFYNYTIAQSGFPAQRLYKHAEDLYTQIASGERNVRMDVTGYDAGHEPEAGEAGAEM